MKNNENEPATRDELQLAVSKAVSDMRASQRWGIGLAVAIILGAISIGAPLILGKQTAEIRAALAESRRSEVSHPSQGPSGRNFSILKGLSSPQGLTSSK